MKVQTIEYKYSSDVSVYFTPIELGMGTYMVEIHDFGNLEGRSIHNVTYSKLNDILTNPIQFIREATYGNS